MKKSFTRQYVYDEQGILLEYDETNSLLARYTHSGLRTDDILSVDITSAGVNKQLAQATGTYQYLKDHQGSITELFHNSGNKVQRFLYSVFGTLLGIQDANAAEITSNPKLVTFFTYTEREYVSESGDVRLPSELL